MIQLASIDSVRPLQFSDLAYDLGHFIVGNVWDRWHVPIRPVMLRSTICNGAIETRVAVMAWFNVSWTSTAFMDVQSFQEMM